MTSRNPHAAKGKRQKAKGKRQKAKGKRQKKIGANNHSPLPRATRSALCFPRHPFQQHLGLLQVRRIEPFGKPIVDRCEPPPRVARFALLPPQPRQTHRRPQLPRLRLLRLGYLNSLEKARLRLALSVEVQKGSIRVFLR